MPILADWSRSVSREVGREIAVVVPLADTSDVPGIYRQSVLDMIAEPGAQNGLYRGLSIEFDAGEMHIVGAALDPPRIKSLVDEQIVKANAWLDAQSRHQDDEAARRAEDAIARRAKVVEDVGIQFRAD